LASDARWRCVFDINTLVSAFLFPRSLPGKALDLVLGKHSLLMSLELAAEATNVLMRENFDRYLTRERREELLAATIRDSLFIMTSTTVAACRDSDDDKLLELAVDGGAAAIVAGAADLLALHPFRNIPILNPRDFLTLIDSKPPA
jgi:putative PIN family toxin of toxin-antitoxin system